MDRELYRLISEAREACAGCNVLPTTKVIGRAKIALQYAIFTGAKRSIIDQLCEADELLRQSKTYADRLRPDELLCGILNSMLKENK